jgi:hypothetical protein
MTHPQSDQRNIRVAQRPMALSPYSPLVIAPVSPLDVPTSAHSPAPRPQDSNLVQMVDGDVLTSTVSEAKRSIVRRLIDDPFWVLMTLTAVLGLSITATLVYGVIQMILAVLLWFTTNATMITGTAVVIVLLMLCGGATAAKCTGIHCGGCKG